MSRVSFTVFDAVTGQILRSGVCRDTLVSAQADTGEVAIQAASNDLTQYVDDPQGTPSLASKTNPGVTQDKASVLSDGVDFVTFGSVPLDAVISVVDPEGVLTEYAHDGTLEYSTELTGSYQVSITGVTYLTQELTFEATS